MYRKPVAALVALRPTMPDACAKEPMECVPSFRVSAADIPEELFERVLHQIGSVHAKKDDDGITSAENCPPSRRPIVNSLTSLIHVSKYFARICRPKLFRILAIRNRKQLEKLLEIDKSSGTVGRPLLAFVRHLHIFSNEDDALWVHRVTTVIIPRTTIISSGISPTVILNADGPLAGVVPTGAHLPRTLPHTLFRNISFVVLKNVRFESEEGLLRGISYFTRSRTMRIESCTCTLTTTRPTFSRVTRSGTWPAVYITDSPTTVATIVTAALCVYAAQRIPAIRPREREDFRLLGEVIVVLYDYLMRSGQRKFCNISTGRCTTFIAVELRPS